MSDTNEKLLARQAQVAEKLAAVGTLAAGLSHELRNPLNAASLQLTVLERRVRRLSPEVQPALVEPLRLAQQELQRLGGILKDFLDFARPCDFIPTPVELATVIDAGLGLLQASVEQAGLRIERDFRLIRQVAGDADRLRQAVSNLLLNAIQATPRQGWVWVETGEKDGEVFLAIEDSGAGIPADVRPHLFEPFFTTKEYGTGLGLPLVHAIIAQHAGQIFVEEGRVGGARFVIKLPPHRSA